MPLTRRLWAKIDGVGFDVQGERTRRGAIKRKASSKPVAAADDGKDSQRSATTSVKKRKKAAALAADEEESGGSGDVSVNMRHKAKAHVKATMDQLSPDMQESSSSFPRPSRPSGRLPP